jgi:hypothetical protein
VVNIQGKPVSTIYGKAVIMEYDQGKEKFMVEYQSDQAIGWLTESQFSLIKIGK